MSQIAKVSFRLDVVLWILKLLRGMLSQIQMTPGNWQLILVADFMF